MNNMPIKDIVPNSKNPRFIKDDKFKKLVKSLKDFPVMTEYREVILDENNVIIGGNMRYKAAIEAGWQEIPTKIFTRADAERNNELTKQDKSYEEYVEELVIKDNVSGGEWDWDMLANRWDTDLLDEWGLDLPNPEKYDEGVSGNLVDKFVAPPFSILDTKQEYWQTRRKIWLSLGIESEVGRSEGLLGDANNMLGEINNGTSIFDPVLCEIIYYWFNITNGIVLDCFAGGSVRGIVASKMGCDYVGVELRSEQVQANIEQAKAICTTKMPKWINGDSTNINEITENKEVDLVFSCPPYVDLEVYSDDPLDLSNMPYEVFLTAYKKIINKSCKQLKDNRFAVFVVGEVRNKAGIYYNFVGDTIKAFEEAGLNYYNEIILVNSAGTLPLRAAKQFNNGRKIGKMHQNVLVFYKGNPKNIKNNYPKLELSTEIE
jgi:16S rRNA G966 N2-methylase RsmD